MKRSPVGSSSRLRKAAWLLIAGALGLVIWGGAVAWAATPPPNVPHGLKGRDNCFICHGPTSTPPITSSHAGRPLATCTGCHAVATLPPDVSGTLIEGAEECLGCHQSHLNVSTESGMTFDGFVDPRAYASSVHGSRLACTDCHTTITRYPHPKLIIPSQRSYAIAQYETCKRCHFTNYTKTLDSIHFQTLASGEQAAPVCTDCHGAHTVRSASEPRAAMAAACGTCHITIYQDYSNSVHGAALRDENNGDVPSCTTCHGVHNIQRAVSAVFRLSSTDLCASCHSDKELMKKYNISADVTQTYLNDFHGKTALLLSKEDTSAWTEKALCVDCHGIHDIRKVDDPQSSVVRANLLNTCQKCHPDATENFPAAWLSHYQPSLQKASLVYYIRSYYWLLIPFMMGGLVLHILLDLWRMARNR